LGGGVEGRLRPVSSPVPLGKKERSC